MKDCYGLCKQCIWYRNGGCSEHNGFEQITYRRQNHCFHCQHFDRDNLKCTYSNKCIAEDKDEKW